MQVAIMLVSSRPAQCSDPSECGCGAAIMQGQDPQAGLRTPLHGRLLRLAERL